MRDPIPFVMFNLRIESKISRRGVEVRRHNIPRHASIAQLIDRREFPRERVWRFISRRSRNTKANALCRCCHGRNAVEGIVDGELGSARDGGLEVRRAFVDVVAAEDVCEEDGVEFCGFEFVGKGHPVFDVVVFGAFVGGVFEEAWVEMTGSLHGEGIEDELFLWLRHDERRLIQEDKQNKMKLLTRLN